MERDSSPAFEKVWDIEQGKVPKKKGEMKRERSLTL